MMKRYNLLFFLLIFISLNAFCIKKKLSQLIRFKYRITSIFTENKKKYQENSLSELQSEMYKDSWQTNVKLSLPSIIVPVSLYYIGFDPESVFIFTNLTAASHTCYDSQKLKQLIDKK